MTRQNQLSAFLLATVLACAPALALGQQSTNTSRHTNTAGQDMRNAGHDTANGARDAGHATEKGTKKAYHKTRTGTKKAYHKTKNTTQGAVQGAKDGAHQPQ